MRSVKHEVHCLKHEVRLLKLDTSSESRFGQTQETFQRLVEDVASLKALGGPLVPCPLEHDMRCLKHEIRVLKERPVAPNAGNSTIIDQLSVLASDVAELKSHPASSLVLEGSRRLEEKVDALTAMITGVSLEQLRHDVKCLKYELKRLLAGNITDNDSRSPAVDKLLGVLKDEVKKDVGAELRIMQREVRRLVNAPPTVLEWKDDGMPVMPQQGAFVSTEIQEIRREIEALRAQVNQTAGDFTQVFVDLPDSATVQLLFRADSPD
jgi:hypothetical protein